MHPRWLRAVRFVLCRAAMHLEAPGRLAPGRGSRPQTRCCAPAREHGLFAMLVRGFHDVTARGHGYGPAPCIHAGSLEAGSMSRGIQLGEFPDGRASADC